MGAPRDLNRDITQPQHQPLNRQSERYRREGSTLADLVGAGTAVLQLLHALIERHVLAAERLVIGLLNDRASLDTP
jgi:hypothetical protein